MLRNFGFETIITSSTANQNSYEKVIKVDFLRPETWDHDELNLPFDFVLHAAAVSPSSINPDFFETNFRSPLKFFNKVQFMDDCKFIFCSTSDVYGRAHPEYVSEISTPAPENEYSESKLLFEDNIVKVIRQNGSKGHLLILRIPTLLGRRVSKNIIHRWIELSIANKEILVFNADKAFSSIILEDDIIRRINLEIQTNVFRKSILNCYSNGDMTYMQTAKLVSKKFGGKLPKIDEASRGPVLTMTNSKEKWFDKLSTEKSMISHLSRL